VRGRRAEFAMVELRRREYVGEAPSITSAAARPQEDGAAVHIGPTAAPLVPIAANLGTTARFGAVARVGAGVALLALAFLVGVSAGVAFNPQPQNLAMPSRMHPHAPASLQSRALASMQSRALERGSLTVSIPRSASDAMASLAFATHSSFLGLAQRPTKPRVVARPQHSDRAGIAFSPSAVTRPQEAGTALTARARPQEAGTALTPAGTASAGANAFSIEAQPWRLTADGTWATEVVAVFTDSTGERQPSLRAGVDFQTSSGEPVVLDPWIHQAPAALITAPGGAGVTVTATATTPVSGSATLDLPPPPSAVDGFATVARVVGPHLIAVGWTPLAPSAGVRQYMVYRHASDGSAQTLVSVVSPIGHAWRDTHVSPDTSYQYSVVAQLPGAIASARTETVRTPESMNVASIDAISGKGMFLFFSPDTNDLNSYEQFDPDAVIAQAQRAGVSEIELRLSRGTFFEAASPQAHEWLNSLIDTAAAANITLLAWSVPRRNSAEDVAQSIAMATYRTPAGNGFAGLALDLEPGTQYMGYGEAARERMADYMEMTRQAVGADYLLVATVISPRITHWTNADYPYSRIARYASALQPMEYWHHYRGGHDYAQTDVSGHCADAVALTRSLAGRNVPVNVAGQSADLGRTGAPSPAELHWCLGAAKSAGAIGEMFFNWRATTPDQWAAIEAYRW
jgi:hypothetical protein